MSDQKQEAVQALVNVGVKKDFAVKVVEQSGYTPSDIIKNPAKVLGDYWYKNVAVDFLDDAIAVNASELKQGLTALQFEDSIVNQAYAAAPRPDLLGHRDIFSWGLVVVEDRL